MDRIGSGFANYCLPMLLANQAGWHLASSHCVEAIWSGSSDPKSVRVEVLTGEGQCPASGHFGFGILTWRVPFLFRTAPGSRLLVRGPANLPKDGIAALEGIVETDSSVATFTMNWMFTRPGHAVRFEVGEPIAFLIPVRPEDLETFTPESFELESDPELDARHRAWAARRRDHTERRSTTGVQRRDRFQLEYIQGRSAVHDRPESHRSKLSLRPFKVP